MPARTLRVLLQTIKRGYLKMPKLTHFIFLSQLLILLPLIVWAKTPCQIANQYVVRALATDIQQKKYFQRALCPTHPEAHNNLAVVLEQEQNYSEAIMHYQQALKNRPNYVKAHLGLGDVYYKQGQLPLSLVHRQGCFYG